MREPAFNRGVEKKGKKHKEKGKEKAEHCN